MKSSKEELIGTLERVSTGKMTYKFMPLEDCEFYAKAILDWMDKEGYVKKSEIKLETLNTTSLNELEDITERLERFTGRFCNGG